MEFPKKEKDKHLGLRIDSELHDKLHDVSQYDGRSANGAVISLIRQRIEQFEREHRKIDLPESQKSAQRLSFCAFFVYNSVS